MLTRLRSYVETVRSSLFFIPMVCVVLAVVLGEAMLVVDASVDGIPDRLTATVDSARTVLTTVAGATLSFAGIAFSVSLLLISLTSSQYSPRVVHGMFRDPFNKRVMGLVIGTFTYCLVVLRAVRSSLEAEGDGIVPSVSILLAVALGVASILAIVAFINHAAHSMDISKILHRVTREALEQARGGWPEPDPETQHDLEGSDRPLPASAATVRFSRYGWVENIDFDQLLAALPPRSRTTLATFAGRYATRNTPICEIWPAPESEDVGDRVRAAVRVGKSRTMQQDVAYGVRQLADVAIKAMSPGINDPTTAHDAISHAGTVLSDLLCRIPPAQRLRGEDGQVLLVPHATTHRELVGLAFDEVRIASAEDPTVLIYLLEVVYQVIRSLDHLDRPDAVAALRAQAELIRVMNEEAGVPEPDRQRVRDVYDARHGRSSGGPTTSGS